MKLMERRNSGTRTTRAEKRRKGQWQYQARVDLPLTAFAECSKRSSLAGSSTGRMTMRNWIRASGRVGRMRVCSGECSNFVTVTVSALHWQKSSSGDRGKTRARRTREITKSSAVAGFCMNLPEDDYASAGPAGARGGRARRQRRAAAFTHGLFAFAPGGLGSHARAFPLRTRS